MKIENPTTQFDDDNDEFSFDEDQLEEDKENIVEQSRKLNIKNVSEVQTIQFKPQNYKIGDVIEINRPFCNSFATLHDDNNNGLYTVYDPELGDTSLVALANKELLKPVKSSEIQIGQAVLWKAGKSAFRRARIEFIHSENKHVDITLIDVGRKIYFMKTSENLFEVDNNWLVSTKAATTEIPRETLYSNLPAKAIMIDHESVETLPVDFSSENDTKYKVKVSAKNYINGWPIYSLELIEKYVNNELVPTIDVEKVKIPPTKKLKTDTPASESRPVKKSTRMTEEEKEARKHERAFNKIMESLLINLGDSVATPGCSVFLEWMTEKTGENSIVLKERLKPEVLPGYKHQATFKISFKLFVMIVEVEDDIREYILQKKQTESWDSVKLDDFKKVFVNFDEAGNARVIFRNFFWSAVNQEIMKAGVNQRIALSEAQFNTVLEAKNDILLKFKSSENKPDSSQ